MAEYQILYWHDIPLQVRAGERDDRVSQALPPRFQVAVDNAAMSLGLIDADEYLGKLAWSEPQEREGSPAEVVAAVAAELEEKYPKVEWQKTVDSLAEQISGKSLTGE